MRILALVVVMAIIYTVYGKKDSAKGTTSRVAAAQAEAAKVVPQQPAAVPAPAPQSGGLRGPIDRTRAVMDLVKERNQ